MRFALCLESAAIDCEFIRSYGKGINAIRHIITYMADEDEAESKKAIEGEEDKKLLVLPLGEESRKLTQVISNETAMKILELLAESPLSTSQISELMNLPITTVQYNVDNLMNVGLIRIDKVKYSEKGREVKIYAPKKKLIVLVPERTDSADVLGVLKKYVALVFFAIVSAGIIELLTQGSRQIAYAPMAPLSEGVAKGGQDVVRSAPDIWSHFAVWFLLGSLVIILLLASYEYISRPRK